MKDIAEVICMIIPHLPIYHYKGKEAKVRTTLEVTFGYTHSSVCRLAHNVHLL